MPLTFRSLRKTTAETVASNTNKLQDSPLRLEDIRADARFLEDITPEFAIRNDILPLRRQGGVTLIAAPDYDRFKTTRPTLEARLGPVAHLPATTGAIRAATASAAGPILAHKALRHTSLRESCRGWSGRRTAVNLAGVVFALFLLGYLIPLWRSGL